MEEFKNGRTIRVAEGEGKPYEAIQDWYEDIKHLVWPFLPEETEIMLRQMK